MSEALTRGSASPARPVVAVVGGGIAGLAAAYTLGGGDETVVLEASARVGGKLRLGQVAGVEVDVGAEAMLQRRPEGVGLARAVGLPVVHPVVVSSRIWTRGALHRLPRSLMGVPLDLADLAATGVLSAAGLERARQERSLPAEPSTGDLSVGELVGRRFGDEVVDRLVEPLLGGVYAGRARELSARAALPQLVDLVSRGSVLAQAGRLAPSYDAGEGSPVFAGVAGGMGRLPAALVAAGRFAVRTGATVRELRRTERGFDLVLGSAGSSETVHAEGVVVATPPAAAARLLRDVAPVAAAELAAIEVASTAVVTLAFRVADVQVVDGGASGFLVPPVEGRRVKAATYSFVKWGWVREAGASRGVAVLRTSLGRHREEAGLQVPDEDLVAASLTDLRAATGLTAEPVDWQVQRWGGGLPQYAVGHLDRVDRIRRAVAAVPGLAVCGAAYDGVGVPAVIASAQTAAARVRAARGDRAE